MIVGFKEKFDWKVNGERPLTHFKKSIYAGLLANYWVKQNENFWYDKSDQETNCDNEEIHAVRKLHTIRKKNKRVYKPGQILHLANGVRTKNFHCFMKIPLDGIQEIEIEFTSGNERDPIVRVDGDGLLPGQIEILAENDGFAKFSDFEKFFWKSTKKGKEIFKGQILHFIAERYGLKTSDEWMEEYIRSGHNLINGIYQDVYKPDGWHSGEYAHYGGGFDENFFSELISYEKFVNKVLSSTCQSMNYERPGLFYRLLSKKNWEFCQNSGKLVKEGD